MTLHTEAHSEINFPVKDVARSHLAMTGSTLHSGGRMTMVIEKYVGFRRQCIDALPGNFFLTIEVLLYFDNFGAVCLHGRMTAHAQGNAGDGCLSVSLRSEVAEGTGQFFLNMLPMAEGNGLTGSTVFGTGRDQKGQNSQSACDQSQSVKPTPSNSHQRVKGAREK